MPKTRRRSRRAKRGVHVSAKSAEPIRYRSSWERIFAEYLDARDDVSSYSYEPYFVEYVSNVRTGRKRKYYPDFEVTMDDGKKILVEVKPKRKLLGAKVRKKSAAALAFCQEREMSFLVITEDELRELGAL